MSTYGIHLLLRLGGITDQIALDDVCTIRQFLVTLAQRVNMRVMDGPHTSTEHGEPVRYGHSGVVILKESHAAIHTYPFRRELFLDLFSCRWFSAAEVLAVCDEYFGTYQVLEHTLLDRGRHWFAPAEERLQEWAVNR